MVPRGGIELASKPMFPFKEILLRSRRTLTATLRRLRLFDARCQPPDLRIVYIVIKAF